MAHTDVTNVIRNRLLLSLSRYDLALVNARLEPVSLEAGQRLIEPDRPIEHVYFIEQGVCSVLAISPKDIRIEVANIGREGMAGLPVLLGLETSPHMTFVQIGGSALRMRSSSLRALMDQSSTLRDALLRYVHMAMIQTSHTALANGAFKIEVRLARWILMCRDRLDSDDIPTTHQLLGMMLCVRRSGVTTALHVLEGEGMIKSMRCLIRVVDRAKLEQLASDSYGMPETEYNRVFEARATPKLVSPAALAGQNARSADLERTQRRA
jgi:CRP-like cAMP-binding protein